MTARRARAARWLKPALVLAFGLAAGLAGAAPANDNFSSAWTISGVAGSTNGDNTAATLETCETNLVNTDDNNQVYITNTVWFAWTATNSGPVEFDTMGSSFDTVLSVWTTANGLCDASLTNLVSDDDNGGYNDPSGNTSTSLLQFNATAGTTYYISVESYDDGTFTGSGGFGAYVLNWNSTPPNDFFANATVLTGLVGTTNGNNALATLEGCETNAVNADNAPNDLITNSVWFAWTAPASGTLEVDTAGSTFETILSVWTTPTGLCDSNLVNVISDDSFSSLDGFTAQVNFPVLAGTTYYISVNSSVGLNPVNGEGNYVLNWNANIPGLPSGTFKFTKATYVVSETDSTGPNSPTVSPSVSGARVTVTRPVPAYGRVLVDYVVTNLLYTNVFTTNFYGTNVTITLIDTNVPPNTTITAVSNNYIYSVNSYQSFNGVGYQNAYVTNAFTNVATLLLSGVFSNSYLVGSAALSPVPTNLPFLTNYSTTVAGNGGGFATSFTTNVFGSLQTFGRVRGTNFLDGSTFTNGSSVVYTNLEVFYTNTFITNFFGTNIYLIYNSTTFNGPSYTTNFYYTNIVAGYVYSTNSIYTNGLSSFSTNHIGTNWVMDTTNMFVSILNASNRQFNASPFVPMIPVPTNFPPLGTATLGFSDTGPTATGETISITNRYNFLVTSSTNVTSAAGFTLSTGTLTFDNFQISQDILVPVNQADGPDVPEHDGDSQLCADFTVQSAA